MKRILVLLILMFSVVGIRANAQTDAQQPIIFLKEGDFFAYTPETGELEQITTWGYNEIPVISPNGNRFVYNSWATVAVESIRAETFPFPSAVFTNIWLWDIPTGEARRLVDQPPNAVAPSLNGSEGIGIVRSTPTWSPDGNQVAWTEFHIPAYEYYLVAYDINTNTSRIVTTDMPLGYQDVQITVHSPKWGSAGIAIMHVDINFQGVVEYTLSVYSSTNGSLVYRNVVNAPNQSILDYVWLTEVPNVVALAFDDGHWEALNVTTGAREVINGTVGVYSLLAPNNFSLTAYPIAGNFEFQWQLTYGTNQTVSLNTWKLTDFVSLSPSGSLFAYVSDALYVFDDGVVSRIAGTEGVSNGIIWGPTSFRLISGGINVGTAQFCATAPPPRLTPGTQARVIPNRGGANVLRDQPFLGESSTRIGSIPENEIMTVLFGPVCGNNVYWWYVDFNGTTGWTGEGENGTYWLEPTP